MTHEAHERHRRTRRRRIRLASSIALLVPVLACAARVAPGRDPASGAASARGHLFMVGGGPQPDALVREFVALAGGPGRARIVVFAMASSEGLTGGAEKAVDLRARGADARNVHVTREQADTDSIARLLDGVTGIWFGGGDQSRLTAALRGTRTEAAIRRRYESGAVVGGTSAGAAVMTALMITGDERRLGGERPPGDSSEAFLTIDRNNIVVAEGFALLPGAIVDQHFVRRKRHNRLISLVLEHPDSIGVGIDESTALIVEPGGHWRVAGASVAVIYDARRSVRTPVGATLGATNVVMHVLPPGSRFDPRRGQASLASPAGSPAK